ncbi:MAG TPA: acyl-CoA dehydrogenase family protein [Kofleriaceae bacterium]|nr:acyl-CoA dehydrogenase family protein [Kofleriaceae bacterium]
MLIPTMDFTPSPTTSDILQRVQRFIRERIAPIEQRYWAEVEARNPGGDWRTWTIPPILDELKAQARSDGLWNLFLPDPELAPPGLSVLDYAPIAEETGRSFLAPEVFNCSAPDTGNMELLWRYGSDDQKRRWLTPLLAGEIRSVFAMTEPDVASSDATNMRATAIVDGDDVVLDGVKWWSTGLGDPRCRLAIYMAHTPSPTADRHHQHSMVLVPLDAPGVVIRRMVPVFSSYHPPHGHGEVQFDSVRVPRSNLIGSAGMGFEIAQGRLGPGRIHHCMRCIGAAEQALDLMIRRGMSRTAFGKPLIDLGGNRERIAEARLAIDQARLLTLHAAWKLDQVGPIAALTEIAGIKVVAPRMLQNIVDNAIQMFGGAGVSDDTPLIRFFGYARMLRIADGPDEVHRAQIAKIELARRGYRSSRATAA